MNRKIVWLLFLFLPALDFAQTSGRAKYWVFLTDKGEINAFNPENFLGPKALARREAQHIQVDYKDFPVNSAYVAEISQTGAELKHPSKWLNAVSGWMSPEELTAVKALPFVKSVKPILPVRLELDPETEIFPSKTNYNAVYAQSQTEMLGLEKLHRIGLSGKGILIAMMDNGFHNVNINAGLDHLFKEDRIKYTWDFVSNESDVYDLGDHGAWTLSILGGFYPGEFIGSAPGADFLLFATENNNGEFHQEEDNWVRAMEVADSLGADIFSTSLGYNVSMMDTVIINGDTIVDYSYQHLDGNTAIITVASDIAASRGIVVINSAGNEGSGTWRHILAPADGDSVIAIGGVNEDKTLAGFSSQGPTFDGRIKPDLCAQGTAVSYLTIEGNIGTGGGTSFACPLMAGLAACLLQSAPGYNNMDLYDALIESADRYATPDTFFGYGIPSAEIAYQIIHGNILPAYNEFHFENFSLAPNPCEGDFSIFAGEIDYELDAEVQIFDSQGRILWYKSHHFFPFYIGDSFEVNAADAGLAHGMYIIRIRDVNANANIYTGRLIVTNNNH